MIATRVTKQPNKTRENIMTTLTATQESKIYTINQEIIDIVGGSDKDAFNELMTSSNPLNAIKHAYKITCKIRNVKINNYFLDL